MRFLKVDELLQDAPEGCISLAMFVDNTTKKLNDFKKLQARVLQIRYMGKNNKTLLKVSCDDDTSIFGFTNLCQEGPNQDFSIVFFEVAFSVFKGKQYHKQTVFQCPASVIPELQVIRQSALVPRIAMFDDDDFAQAESREVSEEVCKTITIQNDEDEPPTKKIVANPIKEKVIVQVEAPQQQKKLLKAKPQIK